MAYKLIIPEPGELVSVSVDSKFLLFREGSAELNSFVVSAGRGPDGAASFEVRLADTDYGREMSNAVRAAITAVNQKWNLPQSAIDGTFDGAHTNSQE